MFYLKKNHLKVKMQNYKNIKCIISFPLSIVGLCCKYIIDGYVGWYDLIFTFVVPTMFDTQIM